MAVAARGKDIRITRSLSPRLSELLLSGDGTRGIFFNRDARRKYAARLKKKKPARRRLGLKTPRREEGGKDGSKPLFLADVSFARSADISL
jgi:hypothetical protein